jgi:hypothetical protein
MKMRKILAIIVVVLAFGNNLKAQSFNQDTAFKMVLEKVPAEYRADLKAQYDTASVEDREFMIVMLSMPTSSKNELIKNIESNLSAISAVKEQYSKMIPADRTVRIVFNPEEKLLKTKENIDIRIMKGKENEYPDVLCQEWNLDYASPKLDSILVTITLDHQKLLDIKRLLESISCISIENGNPTTIGFAYSGMGLYSFKIFDQDLTSLQIENYNDGCEYIFYKNNIVLEYGGGAIGPQCFPDDK